MLLRGRKLLLADDSIAIQKVIELTFEDEGMQVVSVGDGRQALERLAEVRPDIVLADVFMPELNGYQVCEQIKRDERFRGIPVILLVGSFEPFNDAEARRVGADDYLTKPFQSIRQMVSKVGSLLSGRKSDDEEAATQKLPAPPERTQPERQEHLDNLELSTADTAPLPHNMMRTEKDNAAPSRGPFADIQLDDEMIEETPAKEFGFAGQTMAAATQQRSTESLSSQDLAEMGIKPAAAPSPPVAGGAPQRMDETREPVTANESSAMSANNNAPAAKSDNALLELDDVELPRSSAMAEADDFILDLQDTDESQPLAASSEDDVLEPFESARASMPERGIGAEAQQAAVMNVSAPQAMQLIEPQAGASDSSQESAAAEAATEMPPAMDSSQMRDTHELASSPQPVVTEELPENFQPAATPLQAEAVSDETSAHALASQPQPAASQLTELSPEAIEAIARRVVEQLSTTVVERIAWEVVPQLAELLIKRRLEEEGKQ
ncbi:MAG TPA: response regulator [Pyrinomonadaceae bacterium]